MQSMHLADRSDHILLFYQWKDFRKNASTIKSKVCPLRAEEVVLIKKLGYDGWKQLKDTGRRWIAEIVFSSLKRSIR